IYYRFTNRIYSISYNLCFHQNSCICNFISHHTFISWILYEGRSTRSRTSKYCFFCLDIGSNYFNELYLNATFIKLMIEVKNIIKKFGEQRSEEHTSELQSHHELVCRL